MQHLIESNDLLGNPQGLEASWEARGYWFFRGVLDTGAVARFRARCLRFLEDSRVVGSDDPLGHYNGGDLSRFDLNGFNAKSHWKAFVAEPSIRDFFRRLTGSEPVWVPIGECRLSAPSRDPARPKFDFIHTDGFYSPGLYFKTCWVPLVDIDETVGGLALAEGLHRDTRLQQAPITQSDIPADRWRHATYRPGDVVIFDMRTPHTGMVNRSDRFRMSVDVRFVTDKTKVPLIGTLDRIGADYVTVIDDRGAKTTVPITEATLCRDALGNKISPDALAGYFKAGDSLIVGVDNGIATVVRHPK